MDDAFADYLRTSHNNDVDSAVSQQLLDALHTLNTALEKLSADPMIERRAHHEIGSRSVPLEELKAQNARFIGEYEAFLNGAALDPSRFTSELLTHAVDVYEIMGGLAESRDSRAARDAERAGLDLARRVGALEHLQRAYEAGFQRAMDIGTHAKRAHRDASDTAHTR